MNEMIILSGEQIVAGSDYGATAAGGLGIVFFIFGGLWLAGFFDSRPKK